MAVPKNNAWNLSEAKARFSEVVKKAKESPQKVYVSGELAGAFISGEDLKRLERVKMTDMLAILGKFTRAAEVEGVTEEDFVRKGPIKTVSID